MYESIQRAYLKLNTNAASVQSYLGNGHLDLLVLTATTIVFNTLSHIHFIAPRNPVPNTIIPLNQTAAKIYTINQTHKAEAFLYNSIISQTK